MKKLLLLFFTLSFGIAFGQTMLFNSGAAEPGFTLGGWTSGGGTIWHVNLANPATCTVNSGTWNFISFDVGPFLGVNTYEVTSNLGGSYTYNGNIAATHNLNWMGVTTITFTRISGSGAAADHDNFVYTLNICADPDVPSAIAATPSMVCSGDNSTLSWTGNLNDATNWHIYTGSCGGTQIGTSVGNSFVVSPSVTTTYYIRGEDGAGCVDESTGSCGSITVNVDQTAPTAVCQNINVYLDATGNASITAGDLDNGSTDNCGAVSLSASQMAFTCADISVAPTPDQALILTGVIDGPLTGGLPKAVELYVAANIADLSLYGIGSANNGAGSSGVEFTFPSVSAAAGQYLYLATESAEFTNWFGFAPDFVSAIATNINGDDAIELFYNSSVIDLFGDINLSGTGQPWEYMDGWVYRNDFTGPDGNSFILGNWSFSGINALDGEISNASAAAPFPIGTYNSTGSGTTVTLTVTDGNSNISTCNAVVTVLDNLPPTASNPFTTNVQCLSDVPAVDVSVVTDEADNCGIAAVTFVGEVSDGNTCPETLTRTYNVADDHGNAIDVTHTIVVNDDTNPTASNPVTINIECAGDMPAPDVLVVTDEADNCTLAPLVAWVGDVSDGLSCPETITRTYSVSDDCNNMILLQQLIIVNDVTVPVADNALNSVSSSCDVTLTAPTATDNCDGALTATPDVTFPITAVGTTTVTWTYIDNCGNESTQTQDVNISALDVATSLNGLTVMANATGVTYQWIDCFDNSVINGETNQSYTATANGNYAVVITDGGCSDTSACITINTIGINEIGINPVLIFPNPTIDGRFTIQYEGEIISVDVIDYTGRVLVIKSGSSSNNIDCSQLSNGKYLIRIVTQENVITREIVVAR